MHSVGRYVHHRLARRLLHAQRWRAGADWFEPEVAVPGGTAAFQVPGNAVTPDGNHFWVVWEQATAGGSNVMAAVTPGTTATLAFAPPVVVNDDSDCGVHTLPSITLDGAGRAHVVWIDDRFATDVLMGAVRYARSTDAAGTAFAEHSVVSDALFAFSEDRASTLWLGDYLGVAISGGSVFAVWADPRESRVAHFRLASRPLW